MKSFLVVSYVDVAYMGKYQRFKFYEALFFMDIFSFLFLFKI